MKIIVGTRDAGAPASVWAFDDSGNALWTYDTGGNTNDVIMDSSNNIYVVGVRANGSGTNKTLWKLNYLGVLIDSYLYDTTFGFNSIALDGNGNIYASGQIVASKNAVKISADFLTTTAFGKNGTSPSIAIDASDKIWLGGGGSTPTLSKYNTALVEDTTGNLPYDDNTAPLSIDFLSAGEIIIGFQNGVRKFENDGSSPGGGDWTYAGMGVGGRNYSIAVDNDDNIYCSVYNNAAVGQEKVGKLNSAGVEQWTFIPTQTDAMDLDDISVSDSTVIVTGDLADSFNIWLVDPNDGSLTDFAVAGTTGRSVVGQVTGAGEIGTPVTGPDITQVKRLLAAGNNEIWYEGIGDNAGTMAELTDATGDIDTTDQLSMFEAYQKVFIVNGTNLKVADFANTVLDLGSGNEMTTPPGKGDLLTQAGTNATMIVDFVDTAKRYIYGYVSSGTFNITGDITQTTQVEDGLDAMSPNPITATLDDVTAGPHWYDWTAYPAIGSRDYGSLPDKVYISCLYRGRNVISGNPERPHQWYMSRQANPWDFAYIANDAQSPVTGGNSDAGEIGDIIRALAPYKDDYLIFGCATTMWYLSGDATAGGSLNELDLTVGIFGSTSWCFDGDGNFYFWGTNGIYVTLIPGTPKCISQIRLPKLVKDEAADPSTHRITMGYDRLKVGIIICITKLSDGTNSNYFYDLRTGGFFPETYPDECGAYSLFDYAANSAALKGLIVGCNDGYLRKFDSDATDDDIGATDQAINGSVAFGPFPMGDGQKNEGKLVGLDLVSAGGETGGSQADSNNVTFEAYTGLSAASVIENVDAGTNKKLSGTFIAPGKRRGSNIKRKLRGMYGAVKLYNSSAGETWAFEKLLMDLKKSGRLK